MESSLSLPDRVGPVPLEADVILEPRGDGTEEGRGEQGVPAAVAAVGGQAEEWEKSASQEANKVFPAYPASLNIVFLFFIADVMTALVQVCLS